MTFFRIKNIKGKEYAYIVENEWHRKGSRQKVKGYAGRVYGFELKSDTSFMQFMKIDNVGDYIANNDFKNIVGNLVKWELFKFGISNDEFEIDPINLNIRKRKKSVALHINDGFLCSFTLKNLLDFKPGDEQTDGYRLARAFVEAGIKIPQDIFVGLFGKLYREL